MVVEGFHGNRGLVPSSPSVRLLYLPALPATDTCGDPSIGKWVAVMEVVHVRCAGLDISKKDAKVCVRLAGAGRRKAVEIVTTWGSTTNQVLALREHLITEKVTCVVMEATAKEAVLLPARGRRVRGDVGQRPAREEPSRPQDRCG